MGGNVLIAEKQYLISLMDTKNFWMQQKTEREFVTEGINLLKKMDL